MVLSRKLGEKFHIGSDVVITVVDIDRGKIRLGIDAPSDLPIYRQELLPLDNGRESPPCPKGDHLPHGEVKRLRAGLLQLASRTLDHGVKSAVAELLRTNLSGLDVMLVAAAREA